MPETYEQRVARLRDTICFDSDLQVSFITTIDETRARLSKKYFSGDEVYGAYKAGLFANSVLDEISLKTGEDYIEVSRDFDKTTIAEKIISSKKLDLRRLNLMAYYLAYADYLHFLEDGLEPFSFPDFMQRKDDKTKEIVEPILNQRAIRSSKTLQTSNVDGKENFRMVKIDGEDILSTDYETESEEESKEVTQDDKSIKNYCVRLNTEGVQNSFDMSRVSGSFIDVSRASKDNALEQSGSAIDVEKKVCLIDADNATGDSIDTEVDITIAESSGAKSAKKTSEYDIQAKKFLDFMNSSPTTYHVTIHITDLLTSHGFKYLHLKDTLQITEPGFYFTKRDDLSVVAFIIGGEYTSSNGSCFVASHIDALSVKLNQASKTGSVNGYNLINVQPYSGSLNKYWLNRDLGLAGAIIVKDDGNFSRKLIDSKEPIAFIPLLAEHFGIKEDLNYNKQTEMRPIIGTTEKLTPTNDELASPLFQKHPLPLLRYISQLSNTNLKDIVQLDLDFYDTQKAAQGGLDGEFLYSSSLDDRLCAYTSILGLLESKKRLEKSISNYTGLIGCYLANHEEIGSRSRTGAYSGLLKEVLTLVSTFNQKQPTNVIENTARLFTNSVIISSDVTHAFNPNFKDIYLENHLPLLNTGPVLKIDNNMHVLSDSLSRVFLEKVISDHLPDLKLQVFHIRNDSRSGGTIGPILGSASNINGAKIVVDVGIPILSMHSIRSICGYEDIDNGKRFYQSVFDNWVEVI